MTKKVLIVDDSATTRVIHRHLVAKNASCEVVCAADGPEALKIAGSERLDLILMDVMMPHMDGIEVCKRLRSDVKTRTIPVILLTFKRGEEATTAGRESGANEYLTKPVDESALIKTLERYLH